MNEWLVVSSYRNYQLFWFATVVGLQGKSKPKFKNKIAGFLPYKKVQPMTLLSRHSSVAQVMLHDLYNIDRNF
ncbi:hypothetical protein [Brevibacillus daliensis]|uniref:hypothetical protein n=1 Tax=Brevibacillus daliensis TaxID=2892995 RepID=UPI001E3CFDCA|nr:hypothetical protein [Brevibacillus daliensis]